MHSRPNFLYFVPFLEKNSCLDLKKILMSLLDSLLGAIAYGAEVTHLGALGYGAEVRVALAQPRRRGADVAPSSAPRSMAPSSDI
jgi:hypothetical protein